jgi:hypothetical protein
MGTAHAFAFMICRPCDRSTDAREGIDHEADERAVAEADDGRRVDKSVRSAVMGTSSFHQHNLIATAIARKQTTHIAT